MAPALIEWKMIINFIIKHQLLNCVLFKFDKTSKDHIKILYEILEYTICLVLLYSGITQAKEI